MANKIVETLPAILQTPALKNFFEGTVEQLFSKANTINLSGYIGNQSGEEVNLSSPFIEEYNADRTHYSLSPVVNTLNEITDNSENVIFYDEFVDTLKNYGAPAIDQNKLFESNVQTFMPPIDIDKFLNYQEYYWVKGGPTFIVVSATAANPIVVDKDILGKKSFTPAGGKAFKNGMIVKFSGNYVTGSKNVSVGNEYIVEGVGKSIELVDKTLSSSTLYGGIKTDIKDYIVIDRGSKNGTAWSRVNYWYHSSNFSDAGDDLPAKKYRAKRPILCFDKNLEMYNQGNSYKGNVTYSSVVDDKATIVGQTTFQLDTKDIANGDTIIFPNETELVRQYIYTVGGVGASITLTAGSTALADNETVSIHKGYDQVGKEYVFKNGNLDETQQKTAVNQDPLFKLYDDKGNELDNSGLYPQASYVGGKIFGYKLGTGTNDTELGFPLSYSQYKTVSEISFTDHLQSATYTYQAFGSSTVNSIKGEYYFKLLKTINEYHTNFRFVGNQSRQKVKTKYIIGMAEVNDGTRVFDVGCKPQVKSVAPSGYDIVAKVNNKVRTDYTYENNKITFTTANFSKNDILEIEVDTVDGIRNINDSRYDIPLGWKSNPTNTTFEDIAEPEYLPHFKSFIEKQDDFSGSSLGVSNFKDLSVDLTKADSIVKTDEDLMYGAYLLDDQPHNLVDALRFSGREYTKFKKRLIKEITKYNDNFDISGATNEKVLEAVLRNLKSFSIGKDVFSSSYILPYGDNYTTEELIVNDITDLEYSFTNYTDLNKLENSLLIYHVSGTTVNKLLCADEDFTITNTNPITVTLLSDKITLKLDDKIVGKFYNKDRDSAECPPTPSTMGLYPLYVPQIITDDTFQTSIKLLIGHDGSRTTLFSDNRDDILLEFEKRIYTTALKDLRDSLSMPGLNVFNIRPGAFREKVAVSEYNDLLRNSFTNWVSSNKVDSVTNEYYDISNKWTWNHRGKNDLPGHWRGWYEYYYDTVRPHTHPWEMLGFVDKPSWWDTQYGTDYKLTNTNNLWSDLEKGIIRSGSRENYTNNSYTTNNPYTRTGLSNYYPIDSAGALKAPSDITSTGATTHAVSYTNARDGSNTNTITNSIVLTDKLTVDYDTNNVYLVSGTLSNTYGVPILASFTGPTKSVTALPSNAIGITVTGKPILNPKDGTSYASEGNWNYESVYNSTANTIGVFNITSSDAGLNSWDTGNASPIVGWAFDGLPIYGPYGYEDPDDSSSNVVVIKSIFELKTGTRPDGPLGTYTGAFAEDWQANTALAGTNGYVTNAYNLRYAKTVDSATKIYHYVVTLDSDLDPAFPYVIGGVVSESSNLTYSGGYYSAPLASSDNTTGNLTNAGTSSAITSTEVPTTSKDLTLVDNAWQLGDGAPVENAWKYSEDYSFAIAEALLLAKPGKFVTRFAQPLDITSVSIEPKKLIDKDTRSPFDFTSNTDFVIHGTTNVDSTDINTSIGFTQFIHSWLTFQGRNISDNFITNLRTLNIKLGHRLAGFTDKDTLRVRSDQFSPTGKSTSLIIPSENLDLLVHSSPYKSRNFYSGVIIEKTTGGYKVKGYDKNQGYFNVIGSDPNGRTSSQEVGGDPVGYINWQANTSYPVGTIVKYGERFYEAVNFVTSSESFINSLWSSLPGLPQQGAVKGVAYLDSTDEIKRINYNTEYESHQDVYQFLIELGRYQEYQGYDFSNFDTSINEERNWFYAAKQFLFFVSGGWQTSNTLNLSPLASKVQFKKDKEFIAQINRVDRNQFALLDQDGKGITPQDCSILRTDNSIEVTGPEGIQIYGCMLFTKQIEHILVVDNATNFADTIFDSTFGQKQNRLRVKGKKTANWQGKFLSEGYIIEGDELKPNLDNMAQSLGRYHELGFMPVQRKLYETSRKLFGFNERSYMNDLEIDDDTQFEFYTGFLQGKGTANSIVKVAKSNNIIQGNMTLYSEWAVKAGDFGDLENDQAIELKIEKVDIKQNPQLITLAFPEDTTGAVGSIDILTTEHKYYDAPIIEIAKPTSGIQATATATLAANGSLGSFVITEAGKGYDDPVGLTVLAGNVVLSDTDTTLKIPTASSSELISASHTAGDLANFTIIDKKPGSPVTSTYNFAVNTTLANVVTSINNDSTINTNITASLSNSEVVVGNVVVMKHVLNIQGDEFSISGTGSTLTELKLTAGDYTTRQRHSVATVDNEVTLGTGATTVNDIVVTINNTTLTPSGNYSYTAGSRQQVDFVVSAVTVPEDIQRVDPTDLTGTRSDDTVYTGTVHIPLTTLQSDNIVKYEGRYPHVDVYVDGAKLDNSSAYISWLLNSTTMLYINNVENLPGGNLKNGANIYVAESGTITFDSSLKLDTSGANVNIKTTTNDNIAIKTKSIKTFEITPDIKGDETILFDIDDSSRFLKKPIGQRESNLWPTTANVSSKGVIDSKYNFIPNAGYVDERKVDYQVFDTSSISDLFTLDKIYQPDPNETIHVGIAENNDWNVYKVKTVANTTVAFVEQEQGDTTSYLYKNGDSLFKYIDTNFIQGTDTGRFLDYHLIIKDAEVSDKFVVWTNEEQVERKQVRIKNLYPPIMIEKSVTAIGPTSDAVLAISNIEPSPSAFSTCDLVMTSASVATVRTVIFDMENGDSVFFGNTEGNANCALHGLTCIVSNVNQGAGTFTVSKADNPAVVDTALTTMAANTTLSNTMNTSAYLSYSYFGKTKVTTSSPITFSSGEVVKIHAKEYSGYYNVESAGSHHFTITKKHISSSSTTTGNILLPEIQITSANHGISAGYAGKTIAIHKSDPRYYNLVYKVKSIPDVNTIVVHGVFPYIPDSSTQTNCVVTTLDHDVVHLNNNEIKFNNTNSVEAMVQDFNFQQEIKRGFITHDGSFRMSMPMVTNINIPGLPQITPGQVVGKFPYVTQQMFNKINSNPSNQTVTGSTAPIIPVGTIPYNLSVAQSKGFITAPYINTGVYGGMSGTTNSGYITGGTGGPAGISGPISGGHGIAIPPGSGPFTAMVGGTTLQIQNYGDVATAGKDALVDFGVYGQAYVSGISNSFHKKKQNWSRTVSQFVSQVDASSRLSNYRSKYNKVGSWKTTDDGKYAIHPGYFLSGITNTIDPSRGFGLAQGMNQVNINGATHQVADNFLIDLGTAQAKGPGSLTFIKIHNNGGSGNTTSTGQSNGQQPNNTNNNLNTNNGSVVVNPSAVVTNTNKEPCMPTPIFVDPTPNTSNSNVSSPAGNANVVTTPGNGNVIVSTPVSCGFIARERNQQSATTWNLDDTWYYKFKCKGDIKIVFDMYSGADRFDVYQTTTRTNSGGRLVSTTAGKITRNANDSEKSELLNAGSSTHAAGSAAATRSQPPQSSYWPKGSGTHPTGNKLGFHHTGRWSMKGSPGGGIHGGTNQLKNYDYNIGTGRVKYCGVLEFYFDPQFGEHIRIDVSKDSSVYRYYIEYPSDTDQGLASTSNPTPGGTNLPANNGVAGHGSGNPGTTGGVVAPVTPIVTAVGTHVVKNTGPDYASYNNGSLQVGVGGGGGPGNRWDYIYNFRHNFGGFGIPSGGGFSFLPNVFKRTVKSTYQPSIHDYTSLSGSRFVNTSVQRISGGIIVPLAEPVPAPVSIAPRPLRGRDFKEYSSLTGILDLKIHPMMRKTSSRFDTNKLSNIFGDSRAGSHSTIIVDQYPGTPGFTPGTGFSPEGLPMAEGTDVPGSAMTDPEAGGYNTNPVLKLIPKIKDGDGIYRPAGRAIFAPIRYPTPQVCIPINDMTGLTPGDEISINGTRVTIPEGGVDAIFNSILCGTGNGYKASVSAKDGEKALRITSCTNAPLTFRDGCRGGAFKEVLDFHVVRTFDSGESRTNDAVVLGPTVGVYDSSSVTSATAGYTRYLEDGTTAAFPMSTTSTTGATYFNVSKNKSFGGSGYTVGDRLRVVGGTPVAQPHGPITEICIDIAGAGYSSNVELIKVFIGDGTTPGSGANVNVGGVQVDANGSITKVLLENGGSGYSLENPPTVRIIDLDPNSTATPATLRAHIGGVNGMPERVAKFEVTNITATGEILTLRIIDRGVYKLFPSDLTSGVPLEYDHVNIGDEDDGTGIGSGLGQYDPLRNNAKLGSPGGFNPIGYDAGESITPSYTGGSGARIFLTSREIPDCSERGDARRSLGLPEFVNNVDVPFSLANDLNQALIDAGYDPKDLIFGYNPGDGNIGFLGINSDIYDGINFGEMTPGFLTSLGIPAGDYNADLLCMYMTDETSVTESNPEVAGAGDRRDGDGYKIPEQETTREEVSIICIDTLTVDPNSLFGNGNGTNLWSGTQVGGAGYGDNIPDHLKTTFTYTGDLYIYELRSAKDGGPVRLGPSISQNTRVNVLESLRYNKETDIANAAVEFDSIQTTNKTEFANVWVDSYNDGWAYFENGVVKISQEPLVDTKFVKNSILYDDETGKREYDYSLWDPFKGVLPGFIDAEINYVCESDPVTYNSARSSFGSTNVGETWWDTSTIRYKWYEQGSNKQRWQDWGKVMPGSGVSIYEWCETTQLPLEYSGSGTPKNGSEFITETRWSSQIGSHVTFYYYWVQNKESLPTYTTKTSFRKFTALELARYIADPIGQGLNTLSFISNTSIMANNLGNVLREEDDILQINISRNLNPLGLKHNAWKLIREGDNNSSIPEDLSAKLIDSLCEVDSGGAVVPDSTLSEVEKYGIKFRPKQTMFKNPLEARRVMTYFLNDLLADIKINTTNPLWDLSMPSRNYIKDINWHKVLRTDLSNNKKIRYSNNEKAMFTVQSVKELDSLKASGLADGAVVMVKGTTTDRFQLWKWSAKNTEFTLITLENETIHVDRTIYTELVSATLQAELRTFLKILQDDIFKGTENWNKFFFAMMKYAVGEQKQLDWAFKTSYVYVEKEEEDLMQTVAFKPDNFEPVLEYMEEAKAFTAKIREYKDGKKTPIEYIKGSMISDFDKPPYPDPVEGKVRILNPAKTTDVSILETNNDYVKWYGDYALANTIVRSGNVKLVFDRVDYRLLAPEYANHANSSLSVTRNNFHEETANGKEEYNDSIANNIVTLNTLSNASVQANANLTSSARIFKYDTAVRKQFATDVDTYFGAGANANVSYTQNVANMKTIINADGLKKTLDLVKVKVGGGFRGDEIDANIFTKVVQGVDSLSYQSGFGFDTAEWDTSGTFGENFDDLITVENYDGTFTGNVTFRRNNETVEGFDGVTFQRVLYGEDRPEELAYFNPLENLVFKINTSPYAFDTNLNIVGAISIGPYSADSISNVGTTLTVNSTLGAPLLSNGGSITLACSSANINGAHTVSNVTSTAFDVVIAGLTAGDVSGAGTVTLSNGPSTTETQYIVHTDIFGGSEYIRVLGDGSTATNTTSPFYTYSGEIDVGDASKLPEPVPGKPGVIWINGVERIEYRLIVGNIIKQLTRGTRGTTIEDHVSGVSVVSGARTEVFDDPTNAGYAFRDPEIARWLKEDGTTQGLTDITNRSTVSTIAAFLQGDEVGSFGWDVRMWDSDSWDTI